jgi:hypothetical protein
MPKKIPSQKERIRKYLDSGKTLTRLTAWDKLGIVELSARVCTLQDEGYPVKIKIVSVKNRFGEFVRVAKYSRG